MIQFKTISNSHFIALTLLAFGQTAVLAQEEQREFMSGRIGDESIQWLMQTNPSNPSAVFSTLLPDLYNIRISGYADQRFGREGSLIIDFKLRDGEILDPQILYFPFAPRHPRFSFGADHGTGELVVDSVRIESLSVHIKGRFSGELFYHQSPNTTPISHRTQDAEIEFDVVARRQ